ncbi:MAG: hypothetical protein ACXVLQ_16490 [Bacteriovorax sp.]
MGALKKKWDPLPTPHTAPEKKRENENANSAENIRDKAEIDRMKKLLSEKIKDPTLAKKAAMLIAEMLNPKD